MSAPLAPYALFAGMLAMAGLPIYIHAPKFYVDEFGVSLAALGAVLFILRLVDVLQDPVLGWLSERLSMYRRRAVAVAAAIMALAMFSLFAVTPPFAPLLWFAITLALLFSAFSFLTISFYAEGVSKAEQLGADGHVQLAGWRETGALLGVSFAAVAPVLLLGISDAPFLVFTCLFVALTALAVLAMRREWSGAPKGASDGLKPILSDPLARRLLLIALLNATPVAVTSTLFLFFVETRLGAPGWEGPLLLLFFLAAAGAAPVWSRLAQQFGARPVLMLAMVLAVASFGWAALLSSGDVAAFTVICLFSGAALGADMTLLPALFAARMSKVAPSAAEGFGLWSFVSKFSLAFAAIVLLPLLDAAGFRAGSTNQPEEALVALSLSYAVLPCGLKLAALLLLAATPIEASGGTALNGKAQ
ncbi:MAG: MFS transporter [Silicimonas sp.]|nr:MFS transporter [Silicimonas sp.]